MDLEQVQKRKLVELLKESRLTIRPFQKLSKENMTGMGPANSAINEIKDLIKQRGDLSRMPSVIAETPSPLHVETPSSTSNEKFRSFCTDG